jgi:hypothetical protein
MVFRRYRWRVDHLKSERLSRLVSKKFAFANPVRTERRAGASERLPTGRVDLHISL